MQADDRQPVTIVLSEIFLKDIKDLAKSYRSVRKDILPLIERLSNGEIVGDRIKGFDYRIYAHLYLLSKLPPVRDANEIAAKKLEHLEGLRIVRSIASSLTANLGKCPLPPKIAIATTELGEQSRPDRYQHQGELSVDRVLKYDVWILNINSSTFS
jgi:hypothetical protein